MRGRDLVFEIGTEELPSGAVYTALEQLKVSVPKALDDARLEYDEISILASPRRIAITVSDLADSQPDAVQRSKGPAAKAAFDESGNPTQAAIGFARGKGVPVESLDVVEEAGGTYVYATIAITGVEATDVLPALLGQLVCSIEWPKSMRWGSGEARFSRPVRWLMCLFGGEVVPVKFGGLTADRFTYGHRFLSPGALEVSEAGAYGVTLEEANVLVDHNHRAAVLRQGIERASDSLSATAVVPEKTFAEVVNLVEKPTVAVGTFDAEFLSVPKEMLEHAMTSHQRYFPLLRSDGSLDNHFIVAHNGDAARTDAIISGHERVIRARLADAAFFYKEDLSLTLEQWLPKLESVVFQERLGTTAAKVERVERLAGLVGTMIDAPADQSAYALRAAHLAKADLVTNAVVEFTDLQGVMGRYYALAGGEDPQVALAIEEHYRPRFAGDEPPSSVAGRIVSIADKMDTIAGIFSAGLAPKGSADPFGLRRAAIGIMQMSFTGSPVNLRELIGYALVGYAGVQSDEEREKTGDSIREFFVARLQGLLRDRGLAYDNVDAVLAVAADEPADALHRAEALQAAREQSPEAFGDLSVAFKRAANLVGDASGDVNQAILGESERALFDALEAAQSTIELLLAERAYSALLETYAGLRGPIDDFFENVLVMDEDLTLRSNRLALLRRFVSLFERFANFSALAR